MIQIDQQPRRLPALREELTLHEAARLHDGQPGWTLHDPAANRFFRIDWLTFEVLSRWSLEDPALIAAQISRQTPLEVSEQDVLAVASFAQTNQLLRFAGGSSAAKLAGEVASRKTTWWQFLVHNYLFFRVPLLKPERMLKRLSRVFGFLFGTRFWLLTALALVTGILLLTRQWSGFTAALHGFNSFEGILRFLVALVGVKIVHEFGHGLVATHFGCRVPTMGVAFLVMTPVAYTDVNEAWLLKSRRPRLLIGAAGILAELCLAAWATLAWTLLPDGPLRSATLVVAAITWVKSLFVNLSPIMRFDGYYLLSDALNLPNLHRRCFALARWWLRERLFDLGEEPPEYFNRRLRNGLVVLAFAIWIYRLIVFTTIAIFVYHFFFKALGIILFAVEMVWFIFAPIVSELKAWYDMRSKILAKTRTKWVLAALLALVALMLVPLPRRVHFKGELRPAHELRIVTPRAARLVDLPFTDGDRVPAGATLVRLESEAARYQLIEAEQRRADLLTEIESAALNPTQRSKVPVLHAQLQTLDARIDEARATVALLEPAAPFAGVFREAVPFPAKGEWLGKGEELGVLAGDGEWVVHAFLPEETTHLVREGAKARFSAEGAQEHPVELTVERIERDSSRAITRAVLTKSHGGDVPARMMEGVLVPERVVYSVRLRVTDLHGLPADTVRRGQVTVYAEREALAARFMRNVVSVLWRELGF